MLAQFNKREWFLVAYLLTGLLNRMTAMSARLAPMPKDPSEMRMEAVVWSSCEHSKSGPDELVPFSVLSKGPAPRTTTAMSQNAAAAASLSLSLHLPA